MRRLILTLVLTLGMVSVARAQDFEAAGKHFSAAQEAFGAKHFKTAAAEFEAAYGITKDPVLLYNIGESYQKAGNGPKAVASYRQYLHDQPNAQDKAEVQRRIADIEAKGEKLVDQSAPGDTPPAAATQPTTPPPGPAATPPPTPAPAATPPPPPTPPTPESTAPTTGAASPATPPEVAPTPEKVAPGPTTPAPEPAAVPAPAPSAPPPGLLDEGPTTKLRVGAWIGVATTLAFLTAGAILGLAAESRSDEINRRLSFVDMSGQPHKFDQSAANDLDNLQSDGKLYNGLAIGFYSVAAASAVATTVMFIVDARRPHPTQHALRFAPVVGRNAAGLALGGTF